ncbi:MAG: regulatory protein MerR [Clostridiales bacterium]|jgi:hypothetical protein|nr:regulatory protein MerR [Clostridiales bacterium]
MEVCVCKHCGKLYNSRIKSTSCRECAYKDIARFQIVEKFLLDHPRSNAIQLSAALDIKIQEILQYIDEGRLVIINEKVQIPSK